MESNSSHQLRVGIFVFVGIVILLISIVLLGGSKKLFMTYNTYHIYFDQVQGLNEGSVVSLSGLNIGNIRSISFSDSENKIDVLIQVESRFSDKIKEGTLAEIRTQGALGDKFIYLSPGQSDAKPIANNSEIQKQSSQGLIEVLSEKGNEATKIFDIIDELHKLVKTINYDNRTDKIMNNLTSSTQNLNESMIEVKKLISEVRGQDAQSNQIRGALIKLNSILEKVDKGEGTLGALVNDPSLHQQLKTLLGTNKKSQNIKSLIRESIE